MQASTRCFPGAQLRSPAQSVNDAAFLSACPAVSCTPAPWSLHKQPGGHHAQVLTWSGQTPSLPRSAHEWHESLPFRAMMFRHQLEPLWLLCLWCDGFPPASEQEQCPEASPGASFNPVESSVKPLGSRKVLPTQCIWMRDSEGCRAVGHTAESHC